jgi:hypothetical protein
VAGRAIPSGAYTAGAETFPIVPRPFLLLAGLAALSLTAHAQTPDAVRTQAQR